MLSAKAAVGHLVGFSVSKQMDDGAYIFDVPSRIAVASLINKGIEARFAAALVFHDVVCALPIEEGLVPQPPQDMVWQIDCVSFKDGSSWSVFADSDINSLSPRQLDLTGYLVVGTMTNGRALTLAESVTNAMHSDMSQHRRV